MIYPPPPPPCKRGDTEGQREGQNQKTVVNEAEYREGANLEDNKETCKALNVSVRIWIHFIWAVNKMQLSENITFSLQLSVYFKWYY